MRTGTFYEINCTRHGQHVFATDSSIRHYGEEQIKDMLAILRRVLPESEGYCFEVTRWQCNGSAHDL